MENHSITQGIHDELPVWMQNLMWFLRDGVAAPARASVQVFQLACAENGTQIVQLSQEAPPYSKRVEVDAKGKAVTGKIYVLATSGNAVMMLEREFESQKHRSE